MIGIVGGSGVPHALFYGTGYGVWTGAYLLRYWSSYPCRQNKLGLNWLQIANIILVYEHRQGNGLCVLC